MIVVHDYEVWDINIDGWRRAPHKGTEERIREIKNPKARIIPGTAEDVDPAVVDRFGVYRPPSSKD